MSDSVSIRPDQTVDILRPDFIQGWIPLLQSTLTGSVASVTFDISASEYQVFRTLALISQLRTDNAAENDDALIRFNADAGNNYDRVFGNFFADNTRSSSGAIAGTSLLLATCAGANATASNYEPSMAWMPGYRLPDREKWLISAAADFRNVSALSELRVQSLAGRWGIAPIAAITSITVLPSAGANLVANSKLELYGIL